jgi:hypothetical protein
MIDWLVTYWLDVVIFGGAALIGTALGVIIRAYRYWE